MEKVVLIDKESPNTYRVYDASYECETTLCEITGEDCCDGEYTCSQSKTQGSKRGNHVNITVVDDIIIDRDDYKDTVFERASGEDEAYILDCMEHNTAVIEVKSYDNFDEVIVKEYNVEESK